MSLSNLTSPNNTKIYTSPASQLGYEPSTPANWSPVPTTFAEACDTLAAHSGASGPVTSVGLSASPTSVFSVSGSPVTSAGTLALGLDTQAAHTLLAGPTSGSAVPGFRTLAVSDVPTLNQNTTGTAANITASSNSTLTSLPSLVLPGAQVSGNISGSAGNITAAVNSTLTTLPSLVLPTSQLSGTIPIVHGGTGQSTASTGFNALSSCAIAGDIPFESATGVVSALPVGSNGQVLTVNSGLPSWQPATTGTVTSVGLSAAPGSVFSVSGSPVTSTGTLALSMSSQSGNLVLASPAGTSGTPSMRALVAGDLPTSGVTAATYYAPQVTFNAEGMATAASNILTTKGDILTYDTQPDRLAVGFTGQLLTFAPSTTTGLAWLPDSSTIKNIGIATSVAANALTVTLMQGNGTSSLSVSAPGMITFRSSTITTGGNSTIAVTSALTITIPSATTIGTTNSYAGYIYVYALNNAGTVVLALSLSPFPLDALVSSSAISGGSNALTLYSTAAQTSLPIQYLGKFTAPQTTAGTWTANSTKIWSAVSDDYTASLIVSQPGDLLTVNSSNIPSRLAIGSNSQVLTVNSGLPSWQPATTGTVTSVG